MLKVKAEPRQWRIQIRTRHISGSLSEWKYVPGLFFKTKLEAESHIAENYPPEDGRIVRAVFDPYAK